jgi:drug/metabolite transporter, DME family
MQADLRTNRLLLLLTALLFSTGGAAIKMASLTAWQIASYRAGLAAVFLWVALPAARNHWTWRTLVAGTVYAAMVVSFVLSNKLTTAANAILLQSTYPLYLLFLGPLWLRERLRARDLVVVGGVGLGALMIFFSSERAVPTAPDPVRGNLVAVASGFAWALTITALRWMGKRDPQAESAASVVIAGNTIAFLACLPLAAGGSAVHLKSGVIVLYLGFIQVGLGYYFLTRSIRHVRAADAGILLLIEPVLSPLWAWLIHGEQPGAMALGGGAVLLTTALAGTIWQARGR